MTISYIDVNGRRTRVNVAGDPSAPLLVLVHGINTSMEDWAPVVGPLCADYRVVAMDVPGFGYSEDSGAGHSVNALADSVIGVLDALGETRPGQWIGNSLGGAIALAASVRHPERVTALTLISPAGFGRTVTPLLRSLTIPGFGKASVKSPNRASTAMLLRQVFVDQSLANRYRIDHSMAIAQETGAGEFSRRVAVELCTWRGVRPEWRAELLSAAAASPVPTLVIWGAKDRILPSTHAASVRAALPHADLVVLPAVGHMAQIEVTDKFLAITERFLAEAAESESAAG